MEYEKWKKEYEKEVQEHLDANYRICYPYEKEYKEYTQSNGWVMVGTTAEFFRAGTVGKTEEITRKYEILLKGDINIFKGKARDELNRVNPLHDDDKILNDALNHSNFQLLHYDKLSAEEKQAYEEIKKEYINIHKRDIELHKDFLDKHESLKRRIKRNNKYR